MVNMEFWNCVEKRRRMAHKRETAIQAFWIVFGVAVLVLFITALFC